MFTGNNTVREIVSTVEKLDASEQRALLKNIRLFELKVRALKLNKTIKKGKKPSVAEIAAIVRKVRKENARGKA